MTGKGLIVLEDWWGDPEEKLFEKLWKSQTHQESWFLLKVPPLIDTILIRRNLVRCNVLSTSTSRKLCHLCWYRGN